MLFRSTIRVSFLKFRIARPVIRFRRNGSHTVCCREQPSSESVFGPARVVLYLDCVRAIPVPSQGTLSTAQLKFAETNLLPSPDIPSVTADAEQAPRRINPSCFLASPQPLQKLRSSHHYRMTIATILFVVSTAATLSSLTALPCLHV